MSRVELLSDALANQIAAGEVVERPSSVVKELVENAVDAGAKRIRVEVEGGGLSLVRVADDGRGMDARDAALAVLRHATSKIRTLEDLHAIHSFGFRGEALPSIASVSRFTLRSRARDAEEGTEIQLEGGGAPTAGPCGAPIGTTVEVRDLFFNVPARRKFMRAISTESAHVTEVVESAALGEPGVSFTLSRDGRVVKEWRSEAGREARTRSVYAGEALAPIRGERGPLRVEAFLSRPERARSGAAWLAIFVNGRPVKDRGLARSVALAYGSVLEPGRYPVGAVFLDLPHELVDVNVHPQKAEVRFADGRAISDALYKVAAEAVSSAFGLPNPGASRGRAMQLVQDAAPPQAEAWIWSGGGASGPLPVAERAEPTNGSYELPMRPPTSEPARWEPTPAAQAAPIASSGFGALRFVAQVRNMFLLCEGDDGLYIVDQHAAAERVTFHRLKTAYEARSVASQKLLFPAVVTVAPGEVALVEQLVDEIARLGVELRPAGATEIAVHAVPQVLTRTAPERLLRDLLDELGKGGERAFSGAVDLALATMACHGSVRAGDSVAPDEARALLASLEEVDFAGHCPHGRPIVMRVGWGELEHRVGRR